MLLTRVTDALGRTSESYTDEKGRNRQTVQHGESEDVVVKYDYDAVGQVVAVHHPNGTQTTYKYDLLGRKLSVKHPDAGEVTCTYDAAGNLLTKLTAELKKSISDKAPITYTYDYERLSEVLYPENLFNRVTYTYGEAGDDHGRAGRLALVEDASGGEAYYYGRMGEVVKTVRTVMASVADIRTYVYGAEYDSWNRVRKMTYPDGEVVTYHYDEAGQVYSLTSNKNGSESVIVDRIGYDKDGHTVYTKLGNGTETEYTYDDARQRLQEMKLLNADAEPMMQNTYSYDAVDNILGIANTVNPQELSNNSAKLGGESSHTYQYDALNRLISASGKAKDASYTLDMAYNVMSMPVSKAQSVENSSKAASYTNVYKYEDADHPTAPSQIGHEHYTYDANGNPVRVENDSTDATREMFWDEDNRLMVLSDNGKTSRYTYNHAGERIVKSHGSMEGVYINGAPQGITFHETDEYTLYPAAILSVTKNRFTKHYFIGSKRVASRIGSGSFNNMYGVNGSHVTAGQQDYAERLSQIESQKEDYYKKLGIAPGIPTMKGSYADPENTGVGYNTIIKELGDHSVPAEWAQYVKKNTEADTAPGAPIAWDDPSDPDEAQPGYGFVADSSSEEETYFFHSDHLGSTSYITDKDGNITQYDAYLPYGELLVDEHSSSEEMPYKFNGKEFDEETGLYYYGARYMNPVASVWYGVDPLAEKYPNMGAFVYCAANPIKLVDPDGKDWYENKDANGGSNVTWQEGHAKNITINGLHYNNIGETFVAKNEWGTILYEQNKIKNICFNENISDVGKAKKQNTSQTKKDLLLIGTFEQKAANYATTHVSPYQYGEGKCSRYVFNALDYAAGVEINSLPRPAEARNSGPYLIKRGFEVVPNDMTFENALVGDIRVWSNVPGSRKEGHIDIFNGEKWVSDFVQPQNRGANIHYRKYLKFVTYRRKKMNKHLFTFVLCGLIIFASTNICRADNKSTSEGLNTVRFFYEKYIQFRVEEYYATTKVPTDDMACQYRKRKYDILEEFCVDDIVKKQEAEDSNGTQIDLILDDTDVDEISLSSLTVAYCGSHYTVGFQTHSFAFDKTSPITNVELKVWTTDDGKKISNVSGRNLSGIDSYKISPVASVSPENVIVNSCNLTKGDWMFVDSKDNNIVSAAMNFSSTIMTLRINGKKYQNYRYYLSMSEPNKFDGQQVGTASKGGYLVLCGTEFNPKRSLEKISSKM